MRCLVEHITFKNEENNYAIITAVPQGKTRAVCMVGVFPNVIEGMTLEVDGDWVEHPTYGRQFKITSAKEVIPTEKDQIERYLTSGLIKGIGPVLAKRIVEEFGEKSLDIIDKRSNKLTKVKGISPKKALAIWESWDANKYIRELSEFLIPFSVSTNVIVKIYKKYGKLSKDVIKDNPYTLIKEVEGLGFITIDSIATRMGIKHNDPKRIDAGIYYTLQVKAEDGHTCVKRDILCKEASELLQVEPNNIKTQLELLEDDETSNNASVIIENNYVFLKPLYDDEKHVASNINHIIENHVNADIYLSEDSIKRIEKQNNIKYDTIQINAIKTAFKEKFMILTGGPGTGKTTITKGIIDLLINEGLNVRLAAPTGKASKRMKEVTGRDACTIHRLLEYKPGQGFQRRFDNPLEGDVLVVDEFSMVNIILMNYLFSAIPNTMKVILIGDVNQLPAIGPGNVLQDLIETGKISTIKLEKIYRQAMDSKIITIAHAINKGEAININNDKNDDLFFIKETIPDNIIDTIVNLVKKRLPKKYKINPVEDIQILAPMKEGINGIINYNNILQNVFNPEKKGEPTVKSINYTYRIGDKVMQIVNNYDKDVMNGDTGYIRNINKKDKIVTIEFDGAEKLYDFDELSDIILAYASTIHKSQGSEYPIVIIPITKAYYIMLERNLMYTAITRAKKLCIMVGDSTMLGKAIKTAPSKERMTKLKKRVCEFMST